MLSNKYFLCWQIKKIQLPSAVNHDHELVFHLVRWKPPSTFSTTDEKTELTVCIILTHVDESKITKMIQTWSILFWKIIEVVCFRIIPQNSTIFYILDAKSLHLWRLLIRSQICSLQRSQGAWRQHENACFGTLETRTFHSRHFNWSSRGLCISVTTTINKLPTPQNDEFL